MKFVAILIVGSLAVACGSRGKSPSYAAQGERMIPLGEASNRHSVEQSRLSARLMLAPRQTLARAVSIEANKDQRQALRQIDGAD